MDEVSIEEPKIVIVDTSTIPIMMGDLVYCISKNKLGWVTSVYPSNNQITILPFSKTYKKQANVLNNSSFNSKREDLIIGIDPTEAEEFLSCRNTIYDFNKKFEKIYLKKIADAEAERLAGIIACLDSTYNGLYEITTNDLQHTIIIHFPEVEMKNSEHATHKIYDLFVKIQLDVNSLKFLTVIQGTRTSRSKDEINCEYIHSHLNVSNNLAYQTFCLGESQFAILSSELRNNFDLDKFELFLHMLRSYVSWESLEGGPYIKIKNLSSNLREPQDIYGSSDLKNIYTRYIAVSNDLQLSFNKGTEGKFIVDMNKLEQSLTTIFPDKLVGLNTSNNTRFQLNTSSNGDSSRVNEFKGRTGFKFKNTLFSPKIIETTTDESNLTKIIHPQISRHIASLINQNINNYFNTK